MSTATAKEKGTQEEALPPMADDDDRKNDWRTWVLGILAGLFVLGVGGGSAAMNGLSSTTAAQGARIEANKDNLRQWCTAHESRHVTDRAESREDMRELNRKLDEVLARLPADIK